jgi:hypothetical protein
LIAKKLSGGKADVVTYVTSDSRPVLVVRTKAAKSRRRQYTYVEAVTKLDHGLVSSDLDKAYRLAGKKFGANLKRTFIILDDSLPPFTSDGPKPGPVSEVASELAHLGHLGASADARSTTSSTRRGYFTQVSPDYL